MRKDASGNDVTCFVPFLVITDRIDTSTDVCVKRRSKRAILAPTVSGNGRVNDFPMPVH